MFLFNPFSRKKQPKKNVKPSHGEAAQNCELENQLEITIGGVRVKINRCSAFPPVNELSAIIPRAEIRRRYYSNGRLTAEEEIILNSITLVDSPRHPTGGSPQACPKA
ncbi:MAG TPA: hypothetical protein DCZ10_19075 [Pelotomaculum sp.]|nr:hypothetical protein [Pelotomaculum sp.]